MRDSREGGIYRQEELRTGDRKEYTERRKGG